MRVSPDPVPDERPEQRDDVANTRVHLPKRSPKASAVGWWPLCEGYVEAETAVFVQVLLDLSKTGSGNLKPLQHDYYLAIFDWPLDILDSLRPQARKHIRKNATKSRDFRVELKSDPTEDKRYGPMLVPVPEFSQEPKRVPIGLSLPRRERLYVPKGEPQVRINAATAGRIASAPGLDVDREAHPAPPAVVRQRVFGESSLPLDGERPNKLIKCRPEVVHGISDDDTEFDRWRLMEDVDTQRYLSPLRPWLGFETIGICVEEPLYSALKFVDVGFCSADLFENRD